MKNIIWVGYAYLTCENKIDDLITIYTIELYAINDCLEHLPNYLIVRC